MVNINLLNVVIVFMCFLGNECEFFLLLGRDVESLLRVVLN